MTTNKPQTIESKVNNLVKQDLSIVSLHKLISVLYKEVTYKQIPAGLRERFTKPLEDYITGEEWDHLIAFMISDKYVISIRGYKAGGDILQKMKAILKGIFKDDTKPKRLPDPPAEISLEAPVDTPKTTTKEIPSPTLNNALNYNTANHTLGENNMANTNQHPASLKEQIRQYLRDLPSIEYLEYLTGAAVQVAEALKLSRVNMLSTPTLVQLATMHSINNDVLLITNEDKHFFINIFNHATLDPSEYDIFKPYLDTLEKELEANVPYYHDCAAHYELKLSEFNRTSVPTHIYFDYAVVRIGNRTTNKYVRYYQLSALVALMKFKYKAEDKYTPRPINPVHPGTYKDPNMLQNPMPFGRYVTTQQPVEQSIYKTDMPYQPQVAGGLPGGYLDNPSPSMFAMNPFFNVGHGRRSDMFAHELSEESAVTTYTRKLNETMNELDEVDLQIAALQHRRLELKNKMRNIIRTLNIRG